ncbi:reverse transcriptase domain-containing protein [Tanacetum coccineum]
MRTRRSNYPNNSNVTIPRRRRRQVSNIVEPEIRTIVAPMAERTMEELLRAPTEGYGEAIVLPEINADHFEIKTNLLQLVQANPFYGRENDNPHAHINSFKRITSTLRFRNVPNDVIKLMMFPYSLEGAAKTWYEKEPPNSILTWEDLVTKLVNQFFPPSKTTHLKNEISRFTQKFKETFSEAWEQFKKLLRACPHYGFTENKSKVCYSRNKPNASRINATSSKMDERIDKLADQLSTLVEIVSKKVVTPAPVKAVEESCVTCGGAHSWYNCPATDNNQDSVCATTGTYNQVNHPNRVSNQMAPLGFALVVVLILGINWSRPPTKIRLVFVPTTGYANSHGNQVLKWNEKPRNNHQEEAISKVNHQGKLTCASLSNAHHHPSSPRCSELHANCYKTPACSLSDFINLSTHYIHSESDIPKSLPKPNIPYPSRCDDQKSRDKASNQMEKIFQIFQDLRFDISFADALLLMPRFAPTIKSLLMNKEKLLELAKIPLNENCSTMLLKKLPEKLGVLISLSTILSL